MVKTSLNGEWTLEIIGKDHDLTGSGIKAHVPGSVYGTLLECGLMEDPYYRDNELKTLPLMENDFSYTTVFSVTKEMLKRDALFLRFDGVDTLASVYVNGNLVGECDNMHRWYEFELLNECECDLHEGDNELKVYIYSPVKYIKDENEKSFTGGALEAMEGFPHIRKAHCMYGWDWGPRIPDAGIYREVSLIEADHARLDSVYISQEHEDDKVILRFDVDVELLNDDDDTPVTIVVYSPEGEIYTPDDDPFEVVINNPKLWWPNGYGEQPLYTVEVALSDYKKNELDKWVRRIGLRTLTVNTEKDEYGECFAHEVNGVKIFAMGADYIPEDNILSRVNEERTRALLNDAIWANHNCIRVWGGGYYLDDYFYDICDELGLIVWQDLMYACAAYDLTEEFERNITIETHQVLKRLRHHACIGLWCGNNELETQVLDGAWHHTLKQKADYTKMYEYILPKIVKEEAPDAFYWPSSPSSGGAWDNPWDDKRGDVHYWDVWHGEKPFTDYRNYRFRYLSEFGFQSFPELKSVESFTEEGDRNIFSYVMEMHQRNRAANGKILKYVSATYKYPKDFDMLLYTSQLLQADAIRYGVEHFRRNRGQCMGAVVWQLNDIWPVASWASIDYYGRWKALHYAERKMFAPVMISCEETGELSERPYCINEPSPIKISARLHVANETMENVSGTVKWSLRNPDSSVIKEGEETVTVLPLSGIWLSEMDLRPLIGSDDITEEIRFLHNVHMYYSFIVDGEVVSENSVLFTPPKHYEFKNPSLNLTVNGDEITVSAENYAKNVYIEALDGDVKLSDNFFDMEKGTVTVKIIAGSASSFKVRSVFDIA